MKNKFPNIWDFKYGNIYLYFTRTLQLADVQTLNEWTKQKNQIFY